MSQGIVDTLLSGDGWRLMMIVGALPALLVFFIMLFVPESHKWEAERDKGATSHWATRDLLGVLVGAIGAAAVVFLWSPAFRIYVRTCRRRGRRRRRCRSWPMLFAACGSVVGFVVALVGFMYPVVRYLGRAEQAGALDEGDRGRCVRRLLFGACLAGVALLGTWGSLQWAPKWAIALAQIAAGRRRPYFAKEYTQISTALGAIVGTILAALIGRLARPPNHLRVAVRRIVRLARVSVSGERCVSAPSSCGRCSSPAESRPRFTVGFRCICRSCFRRAFARRARGLRSISAA